MADNAGATVSVVTLGCGRNEVDSDQLSGLFTASGHRMVDDPRGADVVLVNTCTFVAPAKQESIDTVLAACDLKDSGTKHVLVVGCMAQRYPQELADAVPEADAVVGFAGYSGLPAMVDDLLAGRPVARVVAEPEPSTATPTVREPGSGRARTALPLLVMPTSEAEVPPEAPPVRRVTTSDDDLARTPASGPRFPVRAIDRSRPWAYLKIAGGCDRVCTFCAIPSFRGRFSSRGVDELLAEAEWLASQGIHELVLVSENTTSWGKDLPGWNGHEGGRRLQPVLLRELAAIDGIERIRPMYLQPAELQWPLLEAMAEIPEVAPYVDLSLQHVSAQVLTAMARSGSPERFIALVERIRDLMPDAALRSSFILGFPGEDERHVTELVDFLEQARLDWVGLFPFSPEDGTPAADLARQVPHDVARERVSRVSVVQEAVADERAARFVGRRMPVLVDQAGPDLVLGRIPQQAPDTDGETRLVTSGGQVPDLPVGRTVDVEITANEGVDLVGVVAGDR